MSGSNEYFQSAFSVDNVIFGFDEGDLKILLIKRAAAPYQDMWALPGALVYPTEDLDSAASRVLYELTGLSKVFLEQVRAFGTVNRHPSGRVITIVYYSLLKIDRYQITPASFAQRADWHSVAAIDELAFDHKKILQVALNRLQQQARISPIGFELLPNRFTLTELQHLYEAILETKLDKRNFRKKVLTTGLLEDTGDLQEGVAHRPAKLYRFDRAQYERLAAEGFYFEVKETGRKIKRAELVD